MFFQYLSYDLRPRLTNSLFILSGWATIYDPNQSICYVLSVAGLRFSTQVSQFAMFGQWPSYDLRPISTNSQCLSVAELRSTTQINRIAMYFLFADAKLRSTTHWSMASHIDAICVRINDPGITSIWHTVIWIKYCWKRRQTPFK